MISRVAVENRIQGSKPKGPTAESRKVLGGRLEFVLVDS